MMRPRLRHALLLFTLPVLMACSQPASVAPAGLHGNPERGRIALMQYACHACHQIPGITGAKVFVGPRLTGLAERKYIAGRLPVNPDNLVAWIRDPQKIDPLTAMPNLQVTQEHALDMTAYLLTLGHQP